MRVELRMAQINCTQKLWRSLRQRGKPASGGAAPVLNSASLGSWAAGLYRIYGRDLVIAVNERTGLTVVFPLATPEAFRSSFAAALAHALEDLGVSAAIAKAESVAVEFEPLTRLSSRSIADMLSHVEYICGIELNYHEDLRKVQRNLNDLPRPDQDPCVPVEAVRLLFEGVQEPKASLH